MLFSSFIDWSSIDLLRCGATSRFSGALFIDRTRAGLEVGLTVRSPLQWTDNMTV
ncbi:MAG: hypothetical protein KME10_29095 [Plectolyngbya sp. WJT66-NPBG17]|jgi:hypothetical protein|nr:hypothetical protein [Plectolyngbya sp. WJT66-NPBG17]